MQLHQIKRAHKNKSKKIIGRGGKRGTTSGKGTKGQKARSGRKLRPESRDALKRIPKLRGYRFKTIENDSAAVPLSLLNKYFNEGQVVSPKTLLEKSIIKNISGKLPTVKILSDGELTKKLKFADCYFSAEARNKVEKSGSVIEK